MDTISREKYDEVSEHIYDSIYEYGGEISSGDLVDVVGTLMDKLNIQRE